MNEQSFRHWRLDYDIDNVCWLTLDRAGERINSLSQEVLSELGQAVSQLRVMALPTANARTAVSPCSMKSWYG